MWLHGDHEWSMTDRDMRFTSNYWAGGRKRLRTNLLMPMALRRQTDGLSEIPNEQVTRYLQALTIHYNHLLDTMLPLAEYAYHMSTTHPPIEAHSNWTLDTHYLFHWTSWWPNGSMTKYAAWKVRCLLNNCRAGYWTPRTSSVRHRTAIRGKQAGA